MILRLKHKYIIKLYGVFLDILVLIFSLLFNFYFVMCMHTKTRKIYILLPINSNYEYCCVLTQDIFIKEDHCRVREMTGS